MNQIGFQFDAPGRDAFMDRLVKERVHYWQEGRRIFWDFRRMASGPEHYFDHSNSPWHAAYPKGSGKCAHQGQTNLWQKLNDATDPTPQVTQELKAKLDRLPDAFWDDTPLCMMARRIFRYGDVTAFLMAWKSEHGFNPKVTPDWLLNRDLVWPDPEDDPDVLEYMNGDRVVWQTQIRFRTDWLAVYRAHGIETDPVKQTLARAGW